MCCGSALKNPDMSMAFRLKPAFDADGRPVFDGVE
jgi:hypothetical protein